MTQAGQLLSAPIYRTREDVSSLFAEIRLFTKIPVPFRLAELSQEDHLIEDDSVSQKAVAVEQKIPTLIPTPPPPTTVSKDIVPTTSQLSPTKPARSRRKQAVSPLPEKKLQQQEEQSKSFAHLMFNFSSTSKKSSLINLPRGIKPTQVRKLVLAKKSKTECGKKTPSGKRSTIVTTVTKAAPSSKARKTSPPRLDLFTRINSAREQENLRKAKLKETAMMEESTIKRRAPVTRTRRRLSNLRPLKQEPLIEPTSISCKTPDSSVSSHDDSGVGDGLSDVFSPFSSYCSTEITDASPLNQEQELDEDQHFELDFDSLDNLFADIDDDMQEQQEPFCSQEETPIDLDDFSWLNDLDL